MLCVFIVSTCGFFMDPLSIYQPVNVRCFSNIPFPLNTWRHHNLTSWTRVYDISTIGIILIDKIIELSENVFHEAVNNTLCWAVHLQTYLDSVSVCPPYSYSVIFTVLV